MKTQILLLSAILFSVSAQASRSAECQAVLDTVIRAHSLPSSLPAGDSRTAGELVRRAQNSGRAFELAQGNTITQRLPEAPKESDFLLPSGRVARIEYEAALARHEQEVARIRSRNYAVERFFREDHEVARLPLERAIADRLIAKDATEADIRRVFDRVEQYSFEDAQRNQSRMDGTDRRLFVYRKSIGDDGERIAAISVHYPSMTYEDQGYRLTYRLNENCQVETVAKVFLRYQREQAFVITPQICAQQRSWAQDARNLSRSGRRAEEYCQLRGGQVIQDQCYCNNSIIDPYSDTCNHALPEEGVQSTFRQLGGSLNLASANRETLRQVSEICARHDLISPSRVTPPTQGPASIVRATVTQN